MIHILLVCARFSLTSFHFFFVTLWGSLLCHRRRSRKTYINMIFYIFRVYCDHLIAHWMDSVYLLTKFCLSEVCAFSVKHNQCTWSSQFRPSFSDRNPDWRVFFRAILAVVVFSNYSRYNFFFFRLTANQSSNFDLVNLPCMVFFQIRIIRRVKYYNIRGDTISLSLIT